MLGHSPLIGLFTARPEAEIARSQIPFENWAVNLQTVAHNRPGLKGL